MTSAADYAAEMSELRSIKPRPLRKLWNNPTPEQEAGWKLRMKDWGARYRRAQKMQRTQLEIDNANFREANQ